MYTVTRRWNWNWDFREIPALPREFEPEAGHPPGTLFLCQMVKMLATLSDLQAQTTQDMWIVTHPWTRVWPTNGIRAYYMKGHKSSYTSVFEGGVSLLHFPECHRHPFGFQKQNSTWSLRWLQCSLPACLWCRPNVPHTNEQVTCELSVSTCPEQTIYDLWLGLSSASQYLSLEIRQSINSEANPEFETLIRRNGRGISTKVGKSYRASNLLLSSTVLASDY